MEKIKEVTFPNEQGHLLEGMLHLAKEKQRAAVLLCHGFRADKENAFLPFLAKELSEHGFTVLRFDFSGSGKSQGKFEELTVTQEIKDLTAAKNFLEKKVGTQDIILIGHSLGGMVALLYTHKHPEIKAVVGIAPPYDYRRKRKSLPDLEKWKKDGHAMLITRFSKKLMKLNYHFYEDAIQHNTWEALQIDVPFLLIQGTEDNAVPLEESKELFSHAKKPKKMVTLEGANHHFDGHEQELLKAILEFLHELHF
ncbi:alpha/beta fold hydrolase [Candidatus Woesearchaeota archaeon]|nr:alpha/beta fold hydrolase [Candidatus Woesearchaeota archaeon]